MTPASSTATTQPQTTTSEPSVEIVTGFEKMLGRLNKLSVEKHFDAYESIDWDNPDYALRPDDSRLRLYTFDPLADTNWYRGLSDADKSRVALFRLASQMRTGWMFENLLQQGLLKTAFTEPNDSPTFRYMHHEVIEESQHSLMFQEFVNRSGLPAEGLPRFFRIIGPTLTDRVRRRGPAFFFLLVLAGEEPVDHYQRLSMREGSSHPLVDRIMKIHVTEEARHISFAKHSLHQEVPKLGRLRTFALSIYAPITLGLMTRIMLKPQADMMRHVGLPKSVIKDLYSSPAGKDSLRSSVYKIQKLWGELGLLNPVARRVWKIVGLWNETPST